MTLTVEASSYDPAPTGTFPARLTQVIDLGVQETAYGDKPQAILGFELVTESIPETDKNFILSKFVTKTLARNSALRDIILAITGKDPKSVDLKDHLGSSCLVTVVHKVSGDSVYANIASVTSVPKKMEVPQAKGPLLAYDLDFPDASVYESLPDWIRRKISYAKPKDKIIIGGKNFAEQKPVQRIEGVPADFESENIPF